MIQGNGFLLRTVYESDVDALYMARSDVSERGDYIPPRMGSQPRFRKEFQETGFWTEDNGVLLVIDPDGRMLGQIAYFRPVFYSDGLEIGYQFFQQASRGKGIMTEVLKLFCSFLFSHRSLYRLQLMVHPGNEASRRVAEKAGFRKEGVLRGAFFHRGDHHDLEIYSLLRDEWTPVPPFTPLDPAG
ncbi:MAG TPA: GNAT family protein [Thermoanaerobaculia bacterium]|nr:GNAT family protein [Thermoanaerobaculia bacterium]